MQLYTINATPNRGRAEQFDNHSVIDITEEYMSAVNKNAIENYPDTVARVLAKHGIDGFTIYQVQGYWEGKPEVSFKIEIAIDDKHWTVDGDVYSVTARVEKICKELRDEYSQDSVMLTLPDNTVKFI